MESLQITATRALRTLLSRQPNEPAKVAFAWRIAAGGPMARATASVWSADGVLRITAPDAAWRREVERARPLVAARLAQLLGPGIVKHIVVEAPDTRRHP